MMPYSPMINTGSQPLSGAGGGSPQFSIYSDKRIVSSSQPVRDQVMMVQTQAEDLEQQINSWKAEQANSPFAKILNS